MTETGATSKDLKRSMLIAFSLPSYVGSAFIAVIVAAHALQGSGSGPEPENPLVLAIGLLMVATLYIGIFAWGFGPFGSAIAVAFLLWDCWRARNIRKHGAFLTCFVFVGPVLWLFSVPWFVESLKW